MILTVLYFMIQFSELTLGRIPDDCKELWIYEHSSLPLDVLTPGLTTRDLPAKLC